MFTNKQLIVPYVAPYFAYVFIASVFGDIVSTEVNYTLRILASGSLIIWAWKWYVPIAGSKSYLASAAWGVLAGIVALFLWIGLLSPFVTPGESEPWSYGSIGLRLIAAGFIVPIFEELLMRCYVFRFAMQWWKFKKNNVSDPIYSSLHESSIDDVAPGSWSWSAVAISTVVFSIGHQVYEWPASIVFSLLMCGLWIYRKDLLSCIVAHGTTNIALAIYVVTTDSWHLW